MDPGYHVSRPVVIMKDQKYPHTGWFIQSKTSSMTKEYCYDIIDEHFLSWTVRETRNGMAKQWANLIFIKKNFERPLSITKKRSLLYAFKSYVVRDRKGPIAGIYCCIRSHSITLFYNREGEKVQVKFPITDISSEAFDQQLKRVARCSTYESAFEFLSSSLKLFKSALEDKDFVEDMLELDDWIEEEA